MHVGGDARRKSTSLSGRAFGPKRIKLKHPKSADKNFKLALKLALEDNQNNEKVFSLLTSAAADGHPDATAAIASWYANGMHVSKNSKLAVEWFRKAAELGSADGYFGIAVALHRGIGGLKKDLKGAFRNYFCAAIRGDAQAVHAVGRCYWHGIGIKKDREIAELWLARADELGVSD